MIQYTDQEWQVILGAYAYEIKDNSLMSDFCYDISAKALAETGTNIPGYDASTGLWINDLIKDREVERILESGYKRWEQEGTAVMWLIPIENRKDLDVGYGFPCDCGYLKVERTSKHIYFKGTCKEVM